MTADRDFVWDITVPFNTTATVYVPTVSASEVTEAGKGGITIWGWMASTQNIVSSLVIITLYQKHIMHSKRSPSHKMSCEDLLETSDR